MQDPPGSCYYRTFRLFLRGGSGGRKEKGGLSQNGSSEESKRRSSEEECGRKCGGGSSGTADTHTSHTAAGGRQRGAAEAAHMSGTHVDMNMGTWRPRAPGGPEPPGAGTKARRRGIVHPPN